MIFVSLAGVPRLNTPPLLSNTPVTSNQDRMTVAPKPIRVPPNLVTRLEDLSQPWTRSPTKSTMDPIVATWHFISSDPSQADSSTIGKLLSFRGISFSFVSSYLLNVLLLNESRPLS